MKYAITIIALCILTVSGCKKEAPVPTLPTIYINPLKNTEWREQPGIYEDQLGGTLHQQLYFENDSFGEWSLSYHITNSNRYEVYHFGYFFYDIHSDTVSIGFDDLVDGERNVKGIVSGDRIILTNNKVFVKIF